MNFQQCFKQSGAVSAGLVGNDWTLCQELNLFLTGAAPIRMYPP